MTLEEIDKEIHKCNLCNDMVEKFPNSNTVSYLLKQLNIINPKIILTLGDSATKSILDIKYKNFSEVVGKEFYLNNIIIIPIYHPSPISPKSYNGNLEIFENLKKYVGEI